MFGASNSVAVCSANYEEQKLVHAALVSAYGKAHKAIATSSLSLFDGVEVIKHLNDAIHAMNIALVKAERELIEQKKAQTQEPVEVAPKPNYTRALRNMAPSDAVSMPPPPTPEQLTSPEKPTLHMHQAEEGDVEIPDEPINEPIKPEPEPPPPPAPKAKPAKAPGAVEQVIADIKAELARFEDWGDYAAVFFDHKVTDVDVLAGKVTNVGTLSAILKALKAKK